MRDILYKTTLFQDLLELILESIEDSLLYKDNILCCSLYMRNGVVTVDTLVSEYMKDTAKK